MKGGNSWHIIISFATHGNKPIQSVTAREEFDLSALQFPEVFVLAGDRLAGQHQASSVGTSKLL